MTENEAHLDIIFRDPKVKYKLDLFNPQERRRLQLVEDGSKIRIRCLARNRDFVAKPEEVVRQLVLNHLHYTLGYPINQLAVEVPIKMGSGYSAKAADIVVYREPQKIVPYIIIEVKKPGRQDGREQLHSYMNATGAPFGMWTNGNTGKQGVAYELRTEPNLYAELPRLPALNETLDDVLEPIRKKDLQPAEDLIGLVKEMQEEVLANAGVNVFEEVFKLFFIKLWDEEQASDDPRDNSSICRFRITADTPEKQQPRFQKLLDEACASYPDIFSVGTTFDLSPQALMVAASVLERIRLTDTDLELIDLTFEYLMSPESKGDKGQYFTPRQVIRMAVKMLNPKSNESLLDPACGPCGFPLMSLVHVRDQEIRRKWRSWEKELQQYGQRRLFAADFDGRVVRVAKFMMRLAGDGRSNVFRMNSLDKREWAQDQQYQRLIADQQFDLIMTNPPFAGTIRHPQILNLYDLAFNETRKQTGNKEELHVIRERKLQSNQTRDVLFLDYCLNKLKPGGRMAIVLPQGHFNNISAEQTRRYIMSKGRILAVVGLHVNAFKPHTGTKTSVLFVQRWAGAEATAWQDWYDDLYEHDRQVAEYEALKRWRAKELKNKKNASQLPKQIRQEPVHPGDPPPPPGDYPIFFATSQRSGRDNSGAYDYLKDSDGQYILRPKVVLAHDEEGERVEIEQMRRVLNTDLDEIADAFLAWGQAQGVDFLADSPYRGRAFSEFVVGADYEISIVLASELEKSWRIDAEYYRPSFLESETLLESSGWSITKLGNLIQEGYRVVYENTEILTEDFDPARHVLFLQATDILTGFPAIEESSMGWVSRNDWERYPKGRAIPGEILVEVKGLAEKVALVPDDFPQEVLVTGTLYKMLINEIKANRYYVLVYLLSRFGKHFRDRLKTNTLISYVNKEQLYNIPIPLLPDTVQTEISNLYQNAYSFFVRSKRLYGEAEQMLLDALGMPNLDLSESVNYHSSLSNAWGAGRLDAEYFHPEKLRILDELSQMPGKMVRDYFYSARSLLTPQREMVEAVYNYDLTHALRYFLDDDIEHVSASELGSTKKRFWSGDLVVSRLRSYLKEIAVVATPKGASCVGSTEFIVLRSRNGNVSPELLLTYLRSAPVQNILKWCQDGSNHPRFQEQELLAIKIPDRILGIQVEIQNLIHRGIEAYRDSRRLLDQSKQKVEQLISGG